MIWFVLVQIHIIQHKQFSKTNVISHVFQQISDLKVFQQSFRRSLKTLWWATYGPLTCS